MCNYTAVIFQLNSNHQMQQMPIPELLVLSRGLSICLVSFCLSACAEPCQQGAVEQTVCFMFEKPSVLKKRSVPEPGTA